MTDKKFEPDTRTEDEAFPDTPCGVEPLGSRIVVQLRTTKNKTRGGILVVKETRDTERYNEVIAKVVKLGPTAYRNLSKPDEYWPEGPWCKVGDIVRTIKWGGDRWTVDIGGEERVSFIIVNDSEIIAKLESYEAARVMQPFVD